MEFTDHGNASRCRKLNFLCNFKLITWMGQPTQLLGSHPPRQFLNDGCLQALESNKRKKKKENIFLKSQINLSFKFSYIHGDLFTGQAFRSL